MRIRATNAIESVNAPEKKSEIYNLTYRYNAAGQVISVSDQPAGGQSKEIQCYRYDHRSRLTDAWTPSDTNCVGDPGTAELAGPAQYQQNFGYDASGNRLSEKLRGAGAAGGAVERAYRYRDDITPTGVRPHAVKRVEASGQKPRDFRYDPYGNMTCRPTAAGNTCTANGGPVAGSQLMTWDNEGHLATTVEQAGETSYVYDADGNRIIRRDPGGDTLYLPGGMEIRRPKRASDP